MKLYVIKRRGNANTPYRGDGCYCNNILDAVLYNQADEAFFALRDLKQYLKMTKTAPDIFVAELEFTETEVVLDVIPAPMRGGHIS